MSNFEQRLYSYSVFTFFQNLGSLYTAYFMGEYYQKSDFPLNWTAFDICSDNWSYLIFSLVFLTGACFGSNLGCLSSFFFGRITTLFLADLLAFVTIIVRTCLTNFTPFFLCRFLIGIVLGINFPTTWLAIKEYVIGKEYLHSILCFQIMNTIGIFLANLVSLGGNWQVLMIIPAIFSLLRGIYNAFLIRNRVDTSLYMFHRRGKNKDDLKLFFRQILSRLSEEFKAHIFNLELKKTMLQESFVIGDLFGPNYLKTVMFCFFIFTLNQASGINDFLSNSNAMFPSRKNIVVPLVFSAVNMIAGILLVFAVPKSQKPFGKMISFGLIKFMVGSVIIIIFQSYFGWVLSYDDSQENYTMFLIFGCFFIVVFQQTEGAFPCLYTALLLPDAGVYIVFGLHYTLGLLTSLIGGTFVEIIQARVWISISALFALIVVSKLWMRRRWWDESLNEISPEPNESNQLDNGSVFRREDDNQVLL